MFRLLTYDRSEEKNHMISIEKHPKKTPMNFSHLSGFKIFGEAENSSFIW